MKQDAWITILTFIASALLIGGIAYGYIMNIYYFASADFKAPYKEEVLRGVGIPLSPFGIIIGYIDLDKTKEGIQ